MYQFYQVCNHGFLKQVLFDAAGVLKQFQSPESILQEFYTTRLGMYSKRKQYLDGMLDAEARKLSNQARFILEKIEGKIIVGELYVLLCSKKAMGGISLQEHLFLSVSVQQGIINMYRNGKFSFLFIFIIP